MATYAPPIRNIVNATINFNMQPQKCHNIYTDEDGELFFGFEGKMNTPFLANDKCIFNEGQDVQMYVKRSTDISHQYIYQYVFMTSTVYTHVTFNCYGKECDDLYDNNMRGNSEIIMKYVMEKDVKDPIRTHVEEHMKRYM